MTTTATEYWVDFVSGDDTTGTGSEGNPWKTIQHAVDTITPDTTNGDAINVVSDETLAASLDLSGYGSPTYRARLTIRGDGGNVAEIDGDGSIIIPSAAEIEPYTCFQDLSFVNYGSGNAVEAGGTNKLLVVGCLFSGGAGGLALLGNGGTVVGCGFENHTGIAISSDGTGATVFVYYCTFYNVLTAVTGYRGNIVIVGNVMSQSSSASPGDSLLYCDLNNGSVEMFHVIGNTLYGNGSGGWGIEARNLEANDLVIVNNIISGFSGTNAKGIVVSDADNQIAIIGNNGFYNNTTNQLLAGAHITAEVGADVFFTSNPFVDAANGDFAPTAEALAAYPALFPSVSSINMSNFGAIGAAQAQAAAGGGRRPRLQIFGR